MAQSNGTSNGTLTWYYTSQRARRRPPAVIISIPSIAAPIPRASCRPGETTKPTQPVGGSALWCCCLKQRAPDKIRTCNLLIRSPGSAVRKVSRSDEPCSTPAPFAARAGWYALVCVTHVSFGHLRVGHGHAGLGAIGMIFIDPRSKLHGAAFVPRGGGAALGLTRMEVRTMHVSAQCGVVVLWCEREVWRAGGDLRGARRVREMIMMETAR